MCLPGELFCILLLVVVIRLSGGDLGWYKQRRADYVGARHVFGVYTVAQHSWYEQRCQLQQCQDLQHKTGLDSQCYVQAPLGLFHSVTFPNMLE